MERFQSLVTKHYEHIEEELNQKQSSDALKKALEQLSPQQKKVYELVKTEGLTYFIRLFLEAQPSAINSLKDVLQFSIIHK